MTHDYNKSKFVWLAQLSPLVGHQLSYSEGRKHLSIDCHSKEAASNMLTAHIASSLIQYFIVDVVTVPYHFCKA